MNNFVDVQVFGYTVFIILTKDKYPDINFIDVGNGKQKKIQNNISKYSTQSIKDCWLFKSNYRLSFFEINEIYQFLFVTTFNSYHK